jgi:hypothetical protein
MLPEDREQSGAAVGYTVAQWQTGARVFVCSVTHCSILVLIHTSLQCQYLQRTTGGGHAIQHQLLFIQHVSMMLINPVSQLAHNVRSMVHVAVAVPQERDCACSHTEQLTPTAS